MSAMAPPVPRPVQPPVQRSRHLGRYDLIGELARGGMGTVYLARHAGEAGFQRLFAIKIMHPHLAEERAFVDMLRDEARIAARIHHPHVVAIVDIGIDEGRHYVVMDYVEGPPYGTLLKRGTGPELLASTVQVVIETLEGLHAAHTLTDEDGKPLHLVHRDVSPQNILVGVDGVARITDFGIAKAETRITSTQPGMRKGKLAFMAPEQITNADTVDARADIWAAGVVLWTALTGKNLFRADNDAATIHNVLSLEVPPPSREGRTPPSHFDAIVLRALQRDREQRYSSALEMADELRRTAAEHGLFGSKQQIAKWVGDTFGEELAMRRKAISLATRRREEQNDYTDASRVSVLPAFPALPGAGSFSSRISGFVDKPGELSIEERSAASIASVTSAPPSQSVQDAAISLEPSPATRKRRPVWLLGAAGIAGGALLTYVLMSRGAPEPQSTQPASPPAAVPAAAQAAAQVAAPSQPATTPVRSSEDRVAQEAQGATQAEATGEPERAVSPTQSPARSYRRVVQRSPAQRSKDAAGTGAETRAEAAPAAPAEPTGGKGTSENSSGFEKNPYMRR